jgi:hypothetical protein
VIIVYIFYKMATSMTKVTDVINNNVESNKRRAERAPNFHPRETRLLVDLVSQPAMLTIIENKGTNGAQTDVSIASSINCCNSIRTRKNSLVNSIVAASLKVT